MEAPISHVSVLEDRAQVTRRGRVELKEGLARLRVEGITPLLQDVSLRVIGRGAGHVVEARARRALTPPPKVDPEAAAELDQRLDALEARVGELGLSQAQLYARQRRLEAALREALAEIPNDVAWGHSAPEVWAAQTTQLFERLHEVRRASALRRFEDSDAREAHEAALTARRALTAHGQAEIRAELEIDALMSSDGALEIEIEYVVPNAIWRPLHRARLEGEALSLSARAALWQRTGEDWRGVKLAFSTARSVESTQPPTLRDDLLQVQRKRNELHVSAREVEIQAVTPPAKGGGGGAPTQGLSRAALPGIDDGGEIRMITASGEHTILSDGRPHMITLGHFTASAEVKRVLIGERVEAVLLQASARNEGEAPLLPGPVELFSEHGGVGWTQLSFTAPGAPLTLGFGPVEGLRVRREVKVKEAKRREGERYRTQTHTALLYLSNLSEAPVQIEVVERLPISEIEQIEIKLLQGKTSGAPRGDEHGIYREPWTIEPLAQMTLSFAWQLRISDEIKGYA